jgi:hypothetical protein
MLAPGTEIRVVAGASKPMEGTLESVTDGEIVLTQGAGPKSVPRPSILSVSIKIQHHRWRNALIGLGLGAGAGAGFGVGRAGCGPGGWCGLDSGVGAAVGGVIGLVAGTVGGLAWPTGGWRKIYAP